MAPMYGNGGGGKAAKADKKATRVEKRAAIGEAKANVKAVKKSFSKGASPKANAKERVLEKIINPPKRDFYDPSRGSFKYAHKIASAKNGLAILGLEPAKKNKK